ncbi:MAG: signal peptidase II [Bacilli bacterium]|nr:signal peptidase II [Bacilli bacterium]
MKKNAKNILLFGLIFVIIDQIVKVVLSSKMIVNQSFVIIKDFFSITLAHNTGAAFSILTGNRYLLIVIGILALIGLFIYIKKLEVFDDIDTFTYSLLIGGIVGNLIDRIVHGYVIDYLSFSFGNFYFPIFNFADICIVISIIIILFRMIKEDLWK